MSLLDVTPPLLPPLPVFPAGSNKFEHVLILLPRQPHALHAPQHR